MSEVESSLVGLSTLSVESDAISGRQMRGGGGKSPTPVGNGLRIILIPFLLTGIFKILSTRAVQSGVKRHFTLPNP